MHEVLKGKKVLVVDDLATARLVVSIVLRQNGVHVVEAGSAEQAIQMAEREAIDAFVLDIQMPGAGGIELCRAIRSMDRYRNTPVIFMTMDQQEFLQQALEAGGNDFIEKPVDALVLRARLSSQLQKAGYLREVELVSLSLQRYVSPRTELIARAYAATGVLPPPTQQEICVLFSDVRGFTELSQELEPQTLFQVLSEHLAAQVTTVYGHGGYVDKFAGDGIMAVFDGEDMTLKCCLCALDILEASKRRVEEEGLRISQLGIGIHKGSAIMGNLGSAQQLDYTLV
jgi:adenylate cyclase